MNEVLQERQAGIFLRKVKQALCSALSWAIGSTGWLAATGWPTACQSKGPWEVARGCCFGACILYFVQSLCGFTCDILLVLHSRYCAFGEHRAASRMMPVACQTQTANYCPAPYCAPLRHCKKTYIQVQNLHSKCESTWVFVSSLQAIPRAVQLLELVILLQRVGKRAERGWGQGY